MEVDQGGGVAGDAMEVDQEEQMSKQFDLLLEQAQDLETSAPDKAPQAYKDIIFNKQELEDPNAKGREQAIYALGGFYVAQKRPTDISALTKELRPLFSDLPKAKTAKIVKTLIDLLAKTTESIHLQIELCIDTIEWCKAEKRTFLRQRVETRLAGLYLQDSKFVQAIDLLEKLLVEVKKLDDKLLLVEIHMLECRTHYAVKNIPKSKAALTASKTNANAIHCPPLMQAEIDLWSGVISAREKDYRTSFSYFYEAFEAFNAAENMKAKTAMKYMLLSKIMQNRPQETSSIINSKSGLKYASTEIEAMAAIAKALEDRALKSFEAVRAQYCMQIDEDPIIAFHLDDLNETLLEQNILRILEPFSRVEIAHVAELIELPLQRTQAKLSEMILDQKLMGTLDQGIGVLIVFEQEQVRSTYDNSLKTIKNTSEVLDTLYGMAKQAA
mmetsp:Transcript_78046/g.218782  ORF Transcript_78046/g.218782 Transcript_78046/m.218782 type:complete len:442 (-) Transcript_78046:175-1500(-)